MFRFSDCVNQWTEIITVEKGRFCCMNENASVVVLPSGIVMPPDYTYFIMQIMATVIRIEGDRGDELSELFAIDLKIPQCEILFPGTLQIVRRRSRVRGIPHCLRLE